MNTENIVASIKHAIETTKDGSVKSILLKANLPLTPRWAITVLDVADLIYYERQLDILKAFFSFKWIKLYGFLK